MNNREMLGLQQYIFTEIQTVTFTGKEEDSLDSFIESITIYSVGGGSMQWRHKVYHHNKNTIFF